MPAILGRTRVATTKTDIISPAIAPAYVGPGDVVASATSWWGLRAYTLASVGTNAVNLRRDSDNATQDFVTVTGGGLDLVSINSFQTGAGAANLWVTKLYDQAGSNNLQQTTAVNQPKFILNVIGSKPAMFFISVSNTNLISASVVPTINQPFTMSVVAQRSSNFTSVQVVLLEGTNNDQLAYDVSTNTIRMYAGTFFTASASDSAFHAFNAVYNGASSNMQVDATSNIGDAGVLGVGGNPWQFGGIPSFMLDGYLTEGGVWPTGFTLSQAANMASNQKTYWGF